MAILIATLVTGTICFYIGWKAGIKEGVRRFEKLKKSYEIFAKQYDEVIAIFANAIDKEIKRIEGEQKNAGTK